MQMMPLDEWFRPGTCAANEKWNLLGLDYALLTHFRLTLISCMRMSCSLTNVAICLALQLHSQYPYPRFLMHPEAVSRSIARPKTMYKAAIKSPLMEYQYQHQQLLY